MGIGDAVKPVQQVSVSELRKDFADKFGIVTWGTPGAEVEDAIPVTLQLKNPLGDEIAVAERLRLTCTPGATMTLQSEGNGSVFSGDGTDDVIIETDDATGTFDLEVGFVGAGTITVVAGVTQGSGMVSCHDVAELVFAGE